MIDRLRRHANGMRERLVRLSDICDGISEFRQEVVKIHYNCLRQSKLGYLKHYIPNYSLDLIIHRMVLQLYTVETQDESSKQ